ncbi:MAG: hypothetical protein WC779_05150 [Candidatus Omnitrophota bacterium]|jgi:predicted nucleotidyltransferase
MTDTVLPQKMTDALNEFVCMLKNTYGSSLVSVMTYGSAAKGTFINGVSRIDAVVVLDDTSLASLSKIKERLRKNVFAPISPVFFTEDYIKKSLDVFPIEFLDMRDDHVVIFGKDVLKDIKIDLRNLRFQCEHELRSKLINIKRAYLAAFNTGAKRETLFKFITSLSHILRNVMRMKGAPHARTSEVLNDVAREFGIDITNVSKAMEAKKNNLKLSDKELDEMLASITQDLEDIIAQVDKL